MAKISIGAICEKLDILTALENRLREGRDFDREKAADMLAEYADLLLALKVDVNI